MSNDVLALPAVRAPGARRALSRRQFGLLLVLPALLVLLAVDIYPILVSLGFSLTDAKLGALEHRSLVGLANYRELLLGDGMLRTVVRNHLVFILFGVGGEFLCGLGIALLLNRTLRFHGLFRVLLLSPVVIAPVVIGLEWRWMLHDQLGIVNYVTARLGLGTRAWLATPEWAMVSVIATWIWSKTPWDALILLAGLASLPADPYDAAAVDGASPWQRFRYITLPLLKPIILINLIFRLIIAIQVFDIIYTMTQGGPVNATELLGLYNYRVAFIYGKVGYASALATATLVLTLALGLILVVLLERVRREA